MTPQLKHVTLPYAREQDGVRYARKLPSHSWFSSGGSVEVALPESLLPVWFLQGRFEHVTGTMLGRQGR